MGSTASGKPRTFRYLAVSLSALAALILSSAVAQANSDEVEGIRRAIKARGARWHADVTPLSKLSPAERKMWLGARDDESQTTAPKPSDTAPEPLVTGTPSTLDWRSIEGVNFVSPVKSQGGCGSCWAFAATAALESQVMIANGGLPIDLSEQILLSCSGAGTCSGGYVTRASDFVRDVGLPLETCFKYTASNNSCDNACTNWRSDTEQISAWNRVSVTTTRVDAMKNALYAYGPIIANMRVYGDFYSYKTGVYSYTSGYYVGGHSVLVVGYDDLNQAFIVKNSWGAGWGEAGFFRIAYSETTGTSNFGYALLAYDGYRGGPLVADTTPPTVAIVAPTSDTMVSDTTAVSVGASDNVGVSSVELLLNGALFGKRSSAPYSFTWDTSKASNGTHTLQAVAYDAAGNRGASAPVDVVVDNAPDATQPLVAINSPGDGSTISKVVKISAGASDDGRLERLEVHAGGSLLGAVNCNGAATCSGSFSWNTNKGVAMGSHTITAHAYDAAGNRGESSVTVYKNR